jgi:hypothetical protein
MRPERTVALGLPVAFAKRSKITRSAGDRVMEMRGLFVGKGDSEVIHLNCSASPEAGQYPVYHGALATPCDPPQPCHATLSRVMPAHRSIVRVYDPDTPNVSR